MGFYQGLSGVYEPSNMLAQRQPHQMPSGGSLPSDTYTSRMQDRAANTTRTVDILGLPEASRMYTEAKAPSLKQPSYLQNKPISYQ